MAQQKTNPKLEQALTRGDLAIRQANSGRATAVLRALGKMIVEASATIGVEAHVVIHDGDKIYDPADGVWPQQLLVSLDGPVEDNDPGRDSHDHAARRYPRDDFPLRMATRRRQYRATGRPSARDGRFHYRRGYSLARRGRLIF